LYALNPKRRSLTASIRSAEKGSCIDPPGAQGRGSGVLLTATLFGLYPFLLRHCADG
jgi:hypothetical protein